MRKIVLAGLLLLLPLVITFWLVKWVILFITDPFLGIAEDLLSHVTPKYALPWMPMLKFSLPILVLAALYFLTCLMGLLARTYFLKKPLKTLDRLFSSTPLIRKMYRLFADVFKHLFGPSSKTAFKNPVVVPFPHKDGQYVMGFLTSKEPYIVGGKTIFAVLIPTAPHPIAGYVLLYPEEEISCVDLSTEDAVRFSVSLGMLYKEKKWRVRSLFEKFHSRKRKTLKVRKAL